MPTCMCTFTFMHLHHLSKLTCTAFKVIFNLRFMKIKIDCTPKTEIIHKIKLEMSLYVQLYAKD